METRVIKDDDRITNCFGQVYYWRHHQLISWKPEYCKEEESGENEEWHQEPPDSLPAYRT
jgi:hypothetical protein